jgi:hypothetical protein
MQTKKLKKRGIYAYVLTKKERYLGIRAFSDSVKQKFTKDKKEFVLNVKRI